MARRLAWLLAALAACVSCGGGGPNGPSDPPPEDLVSVNVVVFYDENDNGLLDASESVRVPGAEIAAGTRTATTAANGRGTILVRRGTATLSLNPRGLPAYFVAGAPVVTTAPATTDVLLPAKLPIGSNIRNKYLPFGDSLTAGEGSSDDRGYRSRLESMLRSHFGAATIVNEGVAGTRSEAGAARVEDALAYGRPAYTLILYGTNDWNEPACKDSRFPCYTIDSLRFMVREAKFIQSLPFIATIPPVNVGYDIRSPQARNDWVARVNPLIKTMAAAEGAVVVDIHAAFVAAGGGKDLFTDHVHPSDKGYALMADEFFKAITRPAAVTAAMAGWPVRGERVRRAISLWREPGPNQYN